jgi:hypothetical protein
MIDRFAELHRQLEALLRAGKEDLTQLQAQTITREEYRRRQALHRARMGELERERCRLLEQARDDARRS